jgi:hypothetical protein
MPSDAQGEYRLKRVGEKADFTLEWSEEIETDPISLSSWTVPAGIFQDTPNPSKTDTTTTIWLSGGTAGNEYPLVNVVTTVGGRVYPRVLRIKILADVLNVPQPEEFTSGQLTALRNAYANGALSVEYDGKRVVYRTLSDIERVISVIEGKLNGTPARNRFSLASFRKG